MEFQLRQENISIAIMPLPFVYTTNAIHNMKMKSNLMFEPGITTEVRERLRKFSCYEATWNVNLSEEKRVPVTSHII